MNLAAQPSQDPTVPKARPRRVLVVDDELPILMLLTRVLEKHGYVVLTASSVKQADKILAHDAIDAVVLDVRMPKQSGLVLLESIRRQDQWRDMPVLLFTGVMLTAEEQELVTRHRAYVFYKPTSYDTLIVYLDKLTRSPE